MSKILKPYTIVPSDLYIQRDADRQIENIINDMGRPGYVLVSRQMGKTNLLLNAKRRLESPEDIYVYIDLSNPFEDIKSCFENIIDIILDTNTDKLSSVSKMILYDRTQHKDLPPHKQHLNELRTILNYIKGKLVVILDEIDALTKKIYSDQIFAQIRSIYFSRVNYSELNRLTYILSGVVEPNEIIKDPKISPFNIGEKIFLNDFSKEEFELFVDKSHLTIGEEVQNRIFYWTDGNPRITWDVCAEVEDRFGSKDITTTDVDKLIHEMYLTTFDRPPVDNIRELVENDRELRNALIEIEYNKSKEISDKIKNKLYLAGIINYNGNDNVHIKNEILKHTLNLDWIKKLEEEDKGVLRLALELYDKRNYKEALSYFEKYLVDQIFEDNDMSVSYYYMGHAAYSISEFNKAIKYLELAKFDKEDAGNIYYRLLNLKGLTFFHLNKYKESLNCFKQVIDSGRQDETYIRSLFNYGSSSLKSGEEEYRNEAIKIFEDVTNEVGFNKEKLKADFINETKSIAHYNLAQIFHEEEQMEKAIYNYRRAIRLSKIETKPVILLGLYSVLKDEDDKLKLIAELVDLIIDNKIIPIVNDPERSMDFNVDNLRQVLILSFLYSKSEFDRLKPWMSHLGKTSFSECLHELAIYAINYNQDWKTGVKLLENIYDNFNNIEFELNDTVKYETLQLLAFVEGKELKRKSEYIALFSENRKFAVNYLDMDIFANAIYILIEKKRYADAVKYIGIINSLKGEVAKELLINYIAIYNLELNAYFYLNKNDKIKEKAREILDLCNDESVKKQKSNLLGDTGLETIRQNAESILFPKAKGLKPIRVGKTYGRNEVVKVKYKDGKIVQTKFKKVETDINQELCFILNE
ncbi:AAA-like domain-containing protein [Dysgonomonas capnocytophagoides]|uniref:AAA-like domain-containing protein n=1 Tax=Dysgonomonas capnocytophagoides TaxID=45254 RepID=UPI002925FF64|nr:hypothetical protein DCPSUM001_18370 [Dysgonomonas capnocytophagoides]